MARTIQSCLGLFTAAVAATAVAAGVSSHFAPETLSAAVALGTAAGSSIGSVGGNLLTDLFKVLHRPAAERWLEGRSAVDENHHIESALRLAHLKALGVVLHRFDTVWRVMPPGDDRQSARDFSHALRDFISPETGTAQRAAFRTDTLPANELQVRRAVLDALPDAFDISLAARRDADETVAIVTSFNQLRDVLENAILEEIRLRTATLDKQVPTAFMRSFQGAGFPESWFDLFIRDAAFRLTRTTGFSSVWQAEQLSIVRAITEAHTASLARIEKGQAEQTATLATIDQRTRRIEQNQDAQPDVLVARLMAAFDARDAEKTGLDRSTIIKLAQRLRPEEMLDFDQAMRELERAVEIASDIVARGQRGTNHDAFVNAVLARVAAETEAGKFDAGARFIDEGLAELDSAHKRSKMALLEAAVRQDTLRRDAPAVAGRIESLVIVEHEATRPAWHPAFRERYDSLYADGGAKGVNFSLTIAIAMAQRMLATATDSNERGNAGNLLGNALWTLGARESGTARLEEAVAAYRAALEEMTRERVPLDWAMTQNNLGNALQTLGARESGTELLEEAVAAYRATLEEWTRERVPLDWATTQNNLGNALQTLGERESDTARLEEAVAAYRAALEEWTRERVPLEWATTQNNLGVALQTLGARESGTARLAEAVAAYRAALEERTRERVPLDWAMTQNNLGNALQTLGARESGTARLAEAVAAYRAALEEMTRERVPLDWAATQNNLGNALRTLGERESGTARLAEAVAAYRAALEERTRERVPLDWATTQHNLGTALWTLGARESGTARLEEAVAAYRAALEEWTRERVPLDWATTQNNLGIALRTLGVRESGTELLEEAVAAYRAALEEWTCERVPLDWAMTQNNLGDALQMLGGREGGTARLEEAVAAWDQCLTVVATAWPPEWVLPIHANREAALAEIARRATAG